MSQSENTIKHNSYFEGNVQSLGLSTEKGPATVGVMKKGHYTFSASSPEIMQVISGQLKIKNAEGTYDTYGAQEHFEVRAGSSFDVMCEDDAAYICYYG